MVRPRVQETDSGITGEFTCEVYDELQRGFRDRGWMRTKDIIKAGMTSGHALEIGPGPGYLGLEWLKSTERTTLTGLDISADMIAVAERNARDYGYEDRVTYVESRAQTMPFSDDHFDAVFTNGSLHEWEDPVQVMNEIARVLRPGGHYFVSDMRRDMNPLLKWLMYLGCKPKAMRPGLLTSVAAAYTPAELRELSNSSHLPNPKVTWNVIGVNCTGCAHHA